MLNLMKTINDINKLNRKFYSIEKICEQNTAYLLLLRDCSFLTTLRWTIIEIKSTKCKKAPMYKPSYYIIYILEGFKTGAFWKLGVSPNH